MKNLIYIFNSIWNIFQTKKNEFKKNYDETIRNVITRKYPVVCAKNKKRENIEVKVIHEENARKREIRENEEKKKNEFKKNYDEPIRNVITRKYPIVCAKNQKIENIEVKVIHEENARKREIREDDEKKKNEFKKNYDSRKYPIVCEKNKKIENIEVKVINEENGKKREIREDDEKKKNEFKKNYDYRKYPIICKKRPKKENIEVKVIHEENARKREIREDDEKEEFENDVKWRPVSNNKNGRFKSKRNIHILNIHKENTRKRTKRERKESDDEDKKGESEYNTKRRKVNRYKWKYNINILNIHKENARKRTKRERNDSDDEDERGILYIEDQYDTKRRKVNRCKLKYNINILNIHKENARKRTIGECNDSDDKDEGDIMRIIIGSYNGKLKSKYANDKEFHETFYYRKRTHEHLNPIITKQNKKRKISVEYDNVMKRNENNKNNDDMKYHLILLVNTYMEIFNAKLVINCLITQAVQDVRIRNYLTKEKLLANNVHPR